MGRGRSGIEDLERARDSGDADESGQDGPEADVARAERLEAHGVAARRVVGGPEEEHAAGRDRADDSRRRQRRHREGVENRGALHAEPRRPVEREAAPDLPGGVDDRDRSLRVLDDEDARVRPASSRRRGRRGSRSRRPRSPPSRGPRSSRSRASRLPRRARRSATRRTCPRRGPRRSGWSRTRPEPSCPSRRRRTGRGACRRRPPAAPPAPSRRSTRRAAASRPGSASSLRPSCPAFPGST